MAQAELLRELAGQTGVFLIDDLGAELDDIHRGRMLALLRSSGCQVISTATRPPNEEIESLFGGENMAMFHVEQGRITAKD